MRAAHRAPLLAALVAAAAALTACTGDDESPAAERSRTPSPSTTPPEDICVRLITYWADDQLRPGGGSESDYQQKGLSDGQNAILLDVVEKAEAERERHGRAAARALVRREVRARCAARYAERGGNEAPPGGWPT